MSMCLHTENRPARLVCTCMLDVHPVVGLAAWAESVAQSQVSTELCMCGTIWAMLKLCDLDLGTQCSTPELVLVSSTECTAQWLCDPARHVE